MFAEPPCRNTGGVEGLNCRTPRVGNPGALMYLLRCWGLVATWHMVPRHSRVPNVEEFGIVSRRLELGYKANHGFYFCRGPILFFLNGCFIVM